MASFDITTLTQEIMRLKDTVTEPAQAVRDEDWENVSDEVPYDVWIKYHSLHVLLGNKGCGDEDYLTWATEKAVRFGLSPAVAELIRKECRTPAGVPGAFAMMTHEQLAAIGY